MQWLRNLPVSRKFFIAFGIVCGLCILLGVYTFFMFRSIAQKNADVSGNHFPSLIQIGDVRDGVNVERRETLELLLCQTPACTTDHTAKRQNAIAEYQNALKAVEPLIIPEERDLYLKFVASIKAYQDFSDRGIGLLAAGKTGDALDLLSSDTVMKSLGDALSAADNGFQLHARIGAEESDAASSASSRATWIGTGITLLIVLLCALIGAILTREIAPRLGRLKVAVEAMAAKDLTASVRVAGEVRRLAERTKGATEQTAASSEISESAGQISQLSVETAQGSEEAVEALKNLASLASDLDGMIRQFRLDDSTQSRITVAGKSQPAFQHTLQPARL